MWEQVELLPDAMRYEYSSRLLDLGLPVQLRLEVPRLAFECLGLRLEKGQVFF